MIRQVEGRGYAEGDCDDVAILAGAIGCASGFGGRYRVLAFDGGPYAHVYTELQELGRGAWFEMDTTRPFQRLPARVSRDLAYNFTR
jgi:hypothetical protein